MTTMRPLVTVPGSGPVAVPRGMQRRRELRRDVRVACEAVADDGFRPLGHRTLDVSTDGMLLETHGAFARVGEEVIVSLRAPDSRVWVDAIARVARIVTGRRRTDRAQAIGLEFVSMDATDRAILGAKLRGYPPPLPSRQPPLDYASMVRAIACG